MSDGQHAKKPFGIAIDSSCTYDSEFIKNNNIIVFPLNINDGVCDYLDNGVDITHQAIIDGLQNKKSYKTAATQLGKMIEMLENEFKKYNEIIFIPISSELSSQYAQTVNVIKPEFPNLHVVNSNTAAIGNEILLKKVVELNNKKISVPNIITTCEQLCRQKIVHFFSVEHVDNLAKGGRGTKAMINFLKITKIKPIVKFYGTNHLAGFGHKYENIVKAMLTKSISFFKKKKIESKDIRSIGILHTLNWDLKKQKYFVKEVCNKFKISINKISFRLIPNTILTHTDVGSFGLCLEII